jgi:hypothetical protein
LVKYQKIEVEGPPEEEVEMEAEKVTEGEEKLVTEKVEADTALMAKGSDTEK